MSNYPKDFAAFILTHGRPDNVPTYQTLKDSGYTGPIYLIIDDLDKTAEGYREKFPNEVIVFDKKAVGKTFDQGNNFSDMRACVYARNAAFDIAKKLGIKYFIQLDDDYFSFKFTFDDRFNFCPTGSPETKKVTNLNRVFSILLKFFINSGTTSLAIAQDGDFLGGPGGQMGSSVFLKRKCMNSWICSTDRPFSFVGTMNDDVNTYTVHGKTGKMFFTCNQISLLQPATQSVAGGMTEIYANMGTYVKTFYTVMYQPSSVKVGTLRGNRIHHQFRWKNTVPKILRESNKKI